MLTARRLQAALVAFLALFAAMSWAAEWPVPLHVVDWGNVRHDAFPATGGVPFPAGMLSPLDVGRLAVRDASGAAAPSQMRAMNTWPDGSVKWLSVAFLCTQAAGNTGRYSLAPADAELPATPELARAVADGIVVDTGPLRALFDANGAHVHLGDTEAAGPLSSRIWTRGRDAETDREYTLSLADATIETNGPVTAVVKVQGWHVSSDGDRFSPSTVRLTFTRGQPFVRVAHTFVMSADPDDTLVSGIELVAPLSRAPGRLSYLDTLVSTTVPLADGGASIVQRNVAEPTYPHRSNEFIGRYDVRVDGAAMATGERYAGAASFLGDGLHVGVYIDQFWQMTPKAVGYDADAGSLALGLWPREGAPDLDLSRTEKRRPEHYERFAAEDPLYSDPKYGPDYVPHDLAHSAMGVARTHDAVLWFSRDAAEVDPLRIYLLFRLPYTPFVSGEWNVATGVMGKQIPPGEHRPELEDVSLSIMDELWNRTEQHGWYGWMEYGNLRYAYDKTRDSWMHYHPKFGWYNSGHMMEGGTLLEALWSQYLRTGSPILHLLAQARGRSVMDVSTVHHHEDASLVGAMIRHGGYDPWAGNRLTHGAHAPLAGIPLHHFLTGDPRAGDVVRLIGDRNYRERDLNLGRNIDTDINTMTRYWEFTGDDRYMSRALEYLDHYHGSLDGAREELTYVDYRTHALRALYEVATDEGTRAKIRDVFTATDEAWADAGRQGNLEMAAFAYELDPNRDTAGRLEAAVERWTRRVSGAVGWLDTMPLRGMNDIATVNAVDYALYWLREARVGQAEPVRMVPDGGTFGLPVVVELASPTRKGVVIYTTEDTANLAEWRLYDGPFELATDATVRAQVFGKALKSPSPTVRAFKFEDAPIRAATPQLWLRADRGVTVEDGVVTGWADQSGYGRHATGDAATGPALLAGAVHGDGSQHLRLSRLVPLTGDCTVVFVADLTGAQGEESLGVVIGDGDDGWIGVTPDGRLSARFSSADRGWRAADGAKTSGRAIWAVIRRRGEVTAWRNGRAIGHVEGTSRTTMNAGVIMGMREGANKMAGALSELMVFGTALDNERLSHLWNYLRGRYDIDDAGE
ncbi:hypothetical protein HN371_21005 [Candidatus Poribacteria bacterium]|jgi:hypothetical protein|nr:hypothetical protein [Candidatus Poribacteria bacterium]MBT5534336.1 hypothetical protein [Candidatus Poribacteria bacterium]MBT5712624.1 hypothetical protein [Candidatus Poribacteria bacterium]MBT7096755.1 hypothetical protein [Candidatus Poribacteria bacterium]MBT7805910.1 hypothetical protein [Candidatus Poribacteria bacterium]